VEKCQPLTESVRETVLVKTRLALFVRESPGIRPTLSDKTSNLFTGGKIKYKRQTDSHGS